MLKLIPFLRHRFIKKFFTLGVVKTRVITGKVETGSSVTAPSRPSILIFGILGVSKPGPLSQPSRSSY